METKTGLFLHIQWLIVSSPLCLADHVPSGSPFVKQILITYRLFYGQWYP